MNHYQKNNIYRLFLKNKMKNSSCIEQDLDISISNLMRVGFLLATYFRSICIAVVALSKVRWCKQGEETEWVRKRASGGESFRPDSFRDDRIVFGGGGRLADVSRAEEARIPLYANNKGNPSPRSSVITDKFNSNLFKWLSFNFVYC